MDNKYAIPNDIRPSTNLRVPISLIIIFMVSVTAVGYAKFQRFMEASYERTELCRIQTANEFKKLKKYLDNNMSKRANTDETAEYKKFIKQRF